ncbi:hypothetical protein [Arcobacter arenosus]|uniref:hypothetical protein n=1 Tax=Arcobacter arenosus TaxID=2576037 RepID=UPI003BA9F318
MKNYKKDLSEHGYIILEKFFSSEEIDTFNNIAIEYFSDERNKFFYHNCGKVITNFFEYVPALRVVLNKKLVEYLKGIIGDIKYIYHNDLSYNMFNNWHRDLSSDYIDGFEDEKIFNLAKIYKVGIYLQNHDLNEYGLSVVPGSHKEFDEKLFKKPINIKSNKGDVIIFDQRLKHKGYYLDEDDKNVCREIEKKSSNIGKDKFEYFKEKREKEKSTKLAIFFGFALENNISKEFARKTIQRQNRQLNMNNYIMSNSLNSYLESINFDKLDIE